MTADVYSLYRIRGIQAFRQCADRFSNGDENEVSIRVESSYTYPVSLEVIDEIPVVFQKRDVDFRTKLQIVSCSEKRYCPRSSCSHQS